MRPLSAGWALRAGVALGALRALSAGRARGATASDGCKKSYDEERAHGEASVHWAMVVVKMSVLGADAAPRGLVEPLAKPLALTPARAP